jgi:lysophospholipase L1-like esterase
MTDRGNRRHLALKLAVSVIVGLTATVVSEMGARLIWKSKYNDWLAGQLHGYDELDRQRSLIIPRAGINLTVEELRSSLRNHGKTISLGQFEEMVDQLSLADSTPILSVNSLRFRGPEFVVPKPDDVFRIVTIGDSVTWGPPIDELTYSAIMERELAQFVNDRCGKRLEVVNAGVPGYNLERVSKRVDEYLAVEPDLVTVFIGWNRTIGRADPRKDQRLYREFALYRFFYHGIVNRSGTGLKEDFAAGTTFDSGDPALAAYSGYDFSEDLNELGRLVEVFTARDIPVHLITLAGVLDWRIAPGQRALEIAYPIASTRNLYAYPLLTRQFNEGIRRVASDLNTGLVDFENFAFREFDPRSDYFTDSVHMTIKGHDAFGRYLAAELRTHVSCGPGGRS